MQPRTHHKIQKLKEVTNDNFNTVIIRAQRVIQVVEVMELITRQYRLNLSKTNDFKRAKHLIHQMTLNN